VGYRAAALRPVLDQRDEHSSASDHTRTICAESMERALLDMLLANGARSARVATRSELGGIGSRAVVVRLVPDSGGGALERVGRSVQADVLR